MKARVSCHFFLILLWIVQLQFAASMGDSKEFSAWIRRCFGTRAAESVVIKSDFREVVKFLTPSSSPISLQELEVPKPSSAEILQIREIINQDANANTFIKYGSPSVRERIINLAKVTPDAAKVIEIPVNEVTGSAVDPTSLPMSKAVLEQAMKLSEEKIADIETRTKYFRNELYQEKRLRLTADLFGSVCLGAKEEALGTWMSSPRPTPDFSREQKVLTPLEAVIKKIIVPCGIFVDVDRGYLAAVPDGLVDDDGIVKLHVLHRPGLDSSRYKWNKGVITWALPQDGKDLAPNRPLYYEIQGLLAITRREICYLIIVTKESMQHAIVKRNKQFWENKMLGILEYFYFNVLQPRISDTRLPNIKHIRLAASILNIVTTEFSNKHAHEILHLTQKGSFDTLILESRLRLLAKDFHIIMDTNKRMKEKVREILENNYKSKNKWEDERESQIAFVRRYANKHNYIVEMGGLIIDRANRFLVALPAAIGYRKQPRKEINVPSMEGEQIEEGDLDGQSVPTGKGGNGSKFGKDAIGRKSRRGDFPMLQTSVKGGQSPQGSQVGTNAKGDKKLGRSGSSLTSAPTRLLKTLSNLGKNKPFQEIAKPDTVIFEVITPEEYEANKNMPGVDSAKKGTRNYYRIQGSLAVSRAKTCIFMVAYPGKKEYVEKIEFDDAVWSEMLEKLKHFYYSVYLIHYASPTEFDRMFLGPTLPEATGWPMGLFQKI